MPDTTVVITYASLDAWDLADYGIGQGSLVRYTGDRETLTITMRRSEQETAEELEDFNENWAWPSATLKDVDPDGNLEVTAYTVTEA